MGDLSQVRVTFTIDLTPYVAGLKTMMSMTSAVGQQLTPLLQVKAGANTKVLDEQLKALQKSTDEYIGSQVQAVGAQDQASVSTDNLSVVTGKASKASNVHAEGMRGVRREALQAFGAISFLGLSIVELTSSTSGADPKLQKLAQGMNQGVASGMSLASTLMLTLGVTQGWAVGIGAVVTVGLTLLKFLDDSEVKAKRNADAMKAFSDSLRGASTAALQDYRKALLDVIVARDKATAAAEKESQSYSWLDKLVAIATEDYIKLALIDSGVSGLRAKNVEDRKSLQTVDDALTAKHKTDTEVRDAIDAAHAASMVNQFAKMRAEENNSYKKSQEDWVGNAGVLEALKGAHNAKMRDINRQEADWNQQLADTQFETELSKIRIHGIQMGVEQSTIDLMIIEARKQHYQKQLDNLDNLVMSERERTKRRADLEKTLTGVIEEEATKRKQVEDAHQVWLDKRSEYSYQKALAELQLYGLKHEQTQETINLKSLNLEKQFTEGQLQQLEVLHDAGKIQDAAFLTSKQQLYVKLAQLDVNRVKAERAAWESTHQYAMVAYQSIGAGARTMFNGLLMNQHQATNLMDAAWQTAQNTAVSALGQILEQAIVNELVTKSMLTASTAAVTASAITIAAAAAPAAMLVSIMSFGTASLAGAESFMAAMAMMKGSMAIFAMDEGGRLKPGEIAYNKSVKNEIFMPEDNLKQIMRAEMIPQLRVDAQRQGAGPGGGIGIGGDRLVSEIRLMHDTLKNMHLEATWEGTTLKAVLKVQDKFDKRAGKKKWLTA